MYYYTLHIKSFAEKKIINSWLRRESVNFESMIFPFTTDKTDDLKNSSMKRRGSVYEQCFFPQFILFVVYLCNEEKKLFQWNVRVNEAVKLIMNPKKSVYNEWMSEWGKKERKKEKKVLLKINKKIKKEKKQTNRCPSIHTILYGPFKSHYLWKYYF